MSQGGSLFTDRRYLRTARGYVRLSLIGNQELSEAFK